MEIFEKLFKANKFVKLYNFLSVIVICILIAFFNKTSFHTIYILIYLISLIYILYLFVSKSLTSVEVNETSGEVKFSFNQFFFFNSALKITIKNFYVSYREEVGARGGKSLVFTLYDIDEQVIIKVSGYLNGWKSSEIAKMYFLFKEIGVSELT